MVAALAGAVAGCSSTDAGIPASPTASADPIPAVQDPKDLTGIAPCDLLSTEQLSRLGFDQPGEVAPFDEIDGIPTCVWRDAARTREATGAAFIGVDALSNLYLQRESYAVFELTDVTGHPALRMQNIAGGKRCRVVLGTAEEQSLGVTFNAIGTGEAPPCAEARRIAETILGNLPPAA